MNSKAGYSKTASSVSVSRLPKVEGIVVPQTPRTMHKGSRDEMNLAEFPLTVLSTRSNPKIKTLEFSDTIKGPAGKPIKREWIITGADKFGLPTSSDDEVLLGLLKLTVDDRLATAKVYFTRYELLKILNWTTEGRSYTRLQNALDRLSGVRIKATNAFYDNETKSFSTKNFGVIDAYEVNDGRDNGNKPSFFIWSEELFRSFQVGFIKKFDLDYYLYLKSAVAKRLYRYLDKLFWYKQKVQFNLFVLCHEKIGISRNFKYASSLKQQLEPGLQELVKTKFISAYEFQGKGKYTEVIVVSANQPRSLDTGVRPHSVGTESEGLSKKRVVSSSVFQVAPEAQSNDVKATLLLNQQAANPNDEASEQRQRLALSLQARGLQEAQSLKLVEQVSTSDIEYAFSVVDYFDELVRLGSDKVSRSPVGFLYKAIEKGRNFNLPKPGKLRNGEKKSPICGSDSDEQGGRITTAKQLRASRDELDRLQETFHRERATLIAQKIDLIDPQKVDRLRAEVDQQLRAIRSALGEETYQRTREGIVDDRIAELLDLDTFDDWVRRAK